MITFTANIRSASARSDDAITTSSVGIPVSLNLASEFAGLAKTIVFKAGTVSVDVALIGDATQATVPVDVLVTSGVWLNVGIYAADGEGIIVIPTVWASAGLIQQGTVPSGVDPSEPTPSWVAQVQSIASEASENAETALNKATAVEEAAARGDFDGRDGTDGFSPIVTVTEISGGHEVAITDANGTQTFTVLNGTNGTDGTDGVDGFSPTVSVEEIPGGHRVTITDIDGEHAFDVMDGQGGGGGGAVDSVNGQTGTVVLDAEDVGALPDTTPIVFGPGTGTNSVVQKTDAGDENTASGKYAVAMGAMAQASGISAVAIGQRTGGVSPTASGDASFAMGKGPTASGNSSQAFGQGTVASANMSSAFGNFTKATGRAAFVIGQANVEDTNDVDTTHGAGARKYIFTIGNGLNDSTRSNALTVDWDGNEVIAGKMTVGAAPTNNMDVATKQYVDSAIPAIPSASSATPQALGTASAGSSSDYSRADHVHAKPSASDMGAVAVAQGVAHAGEFVVVGSDGNITTVTMTAWSGGSY